MKTITTQHDRPTTTATPTADKPPVAPVARHRFALGLDVDLNYCVTASQCDHGASLKKKLAVALARQLAIDLWRWRTGRCSAADLGWTTERGTGTAERGTGKAERGVQPAA